MSQISPNDPYGIFLELINNMIELLRLPGEDYSDGECLDLVAELLTANGFVVFPNDEGWRNLH